jgi:hypothetical protein
MPLDLDELEAEISQVFPPSLVEPNVVEIKPPGDRPGPVTAPGESQRALSNAAPPKRQDDAQRNGYFKCWRNNMGSELWKKHRPAFFLLYEITKRARLDDSFNANGLRRGQAFIGESDMKSLGISAREYRTAKRILQECGFATFKTTNKGTIATLINTSVFEP